jgi:hypothetical protein
MIAPFAESGFRVSRYRDSCCRVSCLFNLRNPKCRIAEIFGRVLLHSCVAFRDFGNSGVKNPDLLSSKLPKCRTPMRSAKAGSPTKLFVDSEFRTSRFRESGYKTPGSSTFKTRNGQRGLTPPIDENTPPVFPTVLCFPRGFLPPVHSSFPAFGT